MDVGAAGGGTGSKKEGEEDEEEEEASNSCDEEILKWLATNGTCSPARSSDGREERRTTGTGDESL